MTDDTLDIVRASPVLRAVQAALFAQCAELVAEVQRAIEGRYLDNATGYSLDVLGRIVGLFPRPGIDALGIIYFSPDVVGAGADRASVYVTGAPLTGFVPVDDVRYRVLIRAKIRKNHTKYGSIPELMSYGMQAYGLPVSVRNEGLGDVSFTVMDGTSAEIVAALINQDTNNLADHIYAMPLPTTARIQRVRFRFPITFAPDAVGAGADVAPVGVGYVVNA